MTTHTRQYPSSSPDQGAIFEHAGHRFMIVERTRDDDAGPPWEACDGHGPVSDWTSREKRPGEVVLSVDRHSRRYYDIREAQRIALRDQWGIPNPGTKTRRQTAREAAQRDFCYLHAWCNNEWEYQILSIVPLNADGDPRAKYTQSLAGIESNSADAYFWEVAFDLAEQAIYEMAEDRKAIPPTTANMLAEVESQVAALRASGWTPARFATALADMLQAPAPQPVDALSIVRALRAWYDENHGTTGPHAGSLFDADRTWDQAITAVLQRAAVPPTHRSTHREEAPQ